MFAGRRSDVTFMAACLLVPYRPPAPRGIPKARAAATDQNGAVQPIPTQMQRGLTKGSVRKSRTERRTASCVRTGSAARARRFRSKTVCGLPPKKPNSGSNRRPRRLGLRRLVAHGSIAGARRSFWILFPRRERSCAGAQSELCLLSALETNSSPPGARSERNLPPPRARREAASKPAPRPRHPRRGPSPPDKAGHRCAPSSSSSWHGPPRPASAWRVTIRASPGAAPARVTRCRGPTRTGRTCRIRTKVLTTWPASIFTRTRSP